MRRRRLWFIPNSGFQISSHLGSTWLVPDNTRFLHTELRHNDDALHSNMLAWRIPWTVYSPRGCKELDMPEQLFHSHFTKEKVENQRGHSSLGDS